MCAYEYDFSIEYLIKLLVMSFNILFLCKIYAFEPYKLNDQGKNASEKM